MLFYAGASFAVSCTYPSVSSRQHSDLGIDIWDGGAGGAMAPPEKNIIRASISSGQYKSSYLKRGTCSHINLFMLCKNGYIQQNLTS